MPSFRRVLVSVAEAYRNNREELLHSSEEILGEMRRVGSAEFGAGELSAELLDGALVSFTRSFDRANGGFGGAPKFPPAMALEFLLRYHHRTKDAKALEMVEKTCRKMADGGMYDQLGGGFHRYSVDAVWLVPHFEKMLYDNAQLAQVYLHAYQATKDEFYRRVAVETLEYVRREMTDADGGFYSAQDADSEGVEGKFFVWTLDEVEEILGAEDARLFGYHYDVSEHGNFEEKNILNVRQTAEDSARQLKVSPDELRGVLRRAKEKLFAERERRVKPLRDEKVLTAWNGLMLAAFAEAAAVLDDPGYLEVARRNADFVLANLQRDGLLLRTYKDGVAKLNAYLEDYANFIDGLITLFETSGEAKYLREARRLADTMLAEFWDGEAGGFYFTGDSHEELVVRSKDFFDNATPSGNSVAADVLLRLAKFLGDENYHRHGVTVLRLVAPQIGRYPQSFGRALSALESYLNPAKEIVILGERGNELEKEVWREFLPGKVVVLAAETSGEADFIPLLEGRKMIGGEATAYVCENFTCRQPVTRVEELREQLSAK